MTENWDDTRYVKDGLITRVDHKRWIAAQQSEKECWEKAWHLHDDWNSWWKSQFDSYEMLEALLPDDPKIIEVGCGPFTNLRLIESVTQYKNPVLYASNPLMESYTNLPSCWIKETNRVLKSNEQLEKLSYTSEFF